MTANDFAKARALLEIDYEALRLSIKIKDASSVDLYIRYDLPILFLLILFLSTFIIFSCGPASMSFFLLPLLEIVNCVIM